MEIWIADTRAMTDSTDSDIYFYDIKKTEGEGGIVMGVGEAIEPTVQGQLQLQCLTMRENLNVM